MMTDLFNYTGSDSSTIDYAILGIGLGIPAIGIVSLMVYRKRK